MIATDGVVTLKAPAPGDAERIIAGRDAEFRRFIGAGADEPSPVACIWVDGELVGWIDYEAGREWLEPGEVNVGYALFPEARGKGYASRALELMVLHLARDTEYGVATLTVDPENGKSLALARRCGFEEAGVVPGRGVFFKRPVRGR